MVVKICLNSTRVLKTKKRVDFLVTGSRSLPPACDLVSADRKMRGCGQGGLWSGVCGCTDYGSSRRLAVRPHQVGGCPPALLGASLSLRPSGQNSCAQVPATTSCADPGLLPRDFRPSASRTLSATWPQLPAGMQVPALQGHACLPWPCQRVQGRGSRGSLQNSQGDSRSRGQIKLEGRLEGPWSSPGGLAGKPAAVAPSTPWSSQISPPA